MTLNGGSDSWKVQRIALIHLREHPSEPLYSEILLNQRVKFHYPLSTMIAFEPLQEMATRAGVNPDRLMNAVGWLFAASFILATAILLERCLADSHHPPDLRHGAAIRLLVVAIATLTFFPFIWGFAKGNWQLWINALFAGALLAWAAGHRAVSGTLIGLMCLIKPHFSLLLVWAALRREWGFAAACVGIGVVGVLASISIYGFSNNIDYVNALSFMSERGATYYHNQSVNGVLNRIMSLFDPVAFPNDGSKNPYPPYTPLVFWGTIVTSALILGAALGWRSYDRVVDFCIMATLLRHRLTDSLDISVRHSPADLRSCYCGGEYGHSSCGSASVTCSQAITSSPLMCLPKSLNVVQSYTLVGGAILLVLLYRLAPGNIVSLDPSMRKADQLVDGHPESRPH